MRKSAVVAYKLFKSNVGQPVTPAALETAMDVGPYAGREVWILKTKLGLDITTQKTGKTVDSYTLTAVPSPEPKLITEHFAKLRKSAAKVAKVEVVPAKAKTVETPAVKTAPAAAKAAPKPKAKKAKAKSVVVEGPAETVVATVEDNGEVAGFSVDPEFDAAELPEFLQRETALAE